MKTKALFTLLSLCIMTLIQSCSSDTEPAAYGSAVDSEVAISHMVVKFEGKIYETDVKMVGDSVIYLNEEYADLYVSKIAPIPELATVLTVKDNVGYVEYFPSKEDVDKKYNFVALQNDSLVRDSRDTRSKVMDFWGDVSGAILIGHAELYDDKHFKDTELILYATTKWANCISYLKDYGFNDKCSSIKVFNDMNPNSYYTMFYQDFWGTHTAQHYGRDLRPVLVCNADSYFASSTKVLYCIAPETGSASVHTDDNLRAIGWNDRISSVGWQIVFDFSLFYGDNPEIPDHADC